MGIPAGDIYMELVSTFLEIGKMEALTRGYRRDINPARIQEYVDALKAAVRETSVTESDLVSFIQPLKLIVKGYYEIALITQAKPELMELRQKLV